MMTICNPEFGYILIGERMLRLSINGFCVGAMPIAIPTRIYIQNHPLG
jgi:hypothetical protein